MQRALIVLLMLLACTSSCGESDEDEDDDGGGTSTSGASGTGGTSGASTDGTTSDVWSCRLDGFGDCMCAREPGGSLPECDGTLPCCASYTMPDFGPICSCRNLEEYLCAQFLAALPAERVSNCPPE